MSVFRWRRCPIFIGALHQVCTLEKSLSAARGAALGRVLEELPSSTPVILGAQLKSPAEPRPEQDIFEVRINPRDGSLIRNYEVDVFSSDCQVDEVKPLASGVLSHSAIATSERPLCLRIGHIFNGNGRAIRFLKAENGTFIADIEEVAMWHGKVTGIVKPLETFAVVRNPTSTGAQYIGDLFELETIDENKPDKITGNIAATLSSGTKVEAELSALIEFPQSKFCIAQR